MATERRDRAPVVAPGARSPFGRLAFIGLIIAGAAWLVLPVEEKITLGLDLQGGTHMVLQVDLDDAVRSSGESTLSDIRREFEDGGIAVGSTTHDVADEILVSGVPDEAREKVEEILAHYEDGWDASWTGDRARLSLRPAAEAAIRANASRQVKETIDRRINEFGVSEPLITTSGTNGERIMIQLPGLDDTERVKRIITTASVMEFRLGRAQAASHEELLAQFGGALPADMEAFPAAPDAKTGPRWYGLARGTIARGEDLIDARDRTDQFGRPCIGFTLSAVAGRHFGEVTGKHINEPLAIVLDGKVLQYATIQDQIFSNGQITGRYTQREAADAALTLRSGGLPAKVTIQHENVVGPALGRDSIDAGLKAVIYASLIIVVFLLIWYKGAGVNAVIALPLNLFLILACLAVLDATLTLPGIAGIVLTVGMAVDANVLVFERIREELALGKAPRQAVDAAFSRAFVTIFDSHMTSLIAAILLYNFGTGPLKGFAVTLGIGILSSIFTAVFVSHALFDLLFWLRPGATRLSIAWRPFKAPSFPFMKYRFTFVGVTVAVALVSAAMALGVPGLPHLAMGIDFEGGTQVVVKAVPGTTAQDLRDRVAGSEFASVTIQQYGDPEKHEFLFRVKDASAAVSTATVNASEVAATAHEEGVVARLVALLGTSEAEVRSVNLNTVGTRTLADALAAAGLTSDEALAAATAVASVRTKAGGLLTSLDGLADAGVPERAMSWLRDNAAIGSVSVLTYESVGPEVGSELRGQAVRAVLWSLVGILIYVAIRFEVGIGVGAILATFHDVLITIGFLAVIGQPIDTSVIAALLTVVGFTLNDKVVVFDRVRELMKSTKGLSLVDVIDRAVNQTFSRTVLTSGLVMSNILSLLVWGGPVLRGFALTMTLGIVIGTYSSIFVASPFVLWWDRLNEWRLRREARAA